MVEGIASELLQKIKEAGGQLVTVGSKQWVEFDGTDAEQRAQPVIAAFVTQYGYKPSFSGPVSDEDDAYDYAIRLD